jgi:UPF0755 protein
MIRAIFLFVIAVFLVGIVLIGSFIWDGFFITPGPDASQVEIVIQPGLNLKKISAILKDNELIESRFGFELYARTTGLASSLQAGSFNLSTGMSYASLVQALMDVSTNEVQVTVIEGMRLSQIWEDVLKENFPHITFEDWQTATGQDSPLFNDYSHLLGSIPEGQDLEGYLFPDTYRFNADASADVIAETMLLTLERRLAEEDITVPEDFKMENGMSFHELITFASIVQREVRSNEEMKLVAGIFASRIDIGMALQSDATVTYITGGKDPSPTFEETRIDSPYNTYLHAGLPPGPVSHPGIDAIVASLYPTDSDYLFFLTTDEGEVIYSSTFNEHVANKYKYLK